MSCEERNNSTDLSNFPSDSFLGTFISSFPSEWQGFFGVLNAASPNPVQNASIWLQQKQTSSKNSQIPPNFSILFEHLTQDFPVVLENNLYFKPKVLVFPLHLQRNILSFILSKTASIPLEFLKNLVTKLDDFKDNLEGWSSTLGKLLKVKIKELEREDSSLQEGAKFYVDVITEESKDRFLSICEEINKKYPCIDKNYPSEAKWISLEDEMGERVKEIQDMSPGITNLLAEICDDDFELELIEKWDEKQNIEPEKMDIDVAENPQRDNSDQKTAENKAMGTPSPSKKAKMEEKCDEIKNGVPPAPETFEVTHKESVVTDELKTKIAPLEILIQALESSEVVTTTNCLDALKLFCELSSFEIESISNVVKLEDLSDQTIPTICQNFAALEPEASYMHACAFASHFILPRLKKLDQMAPRLLTGALISFSKKYPKAVCEGLFLRLLNDTSFSSLQADVISKTLKDMPNQEASKYLLEILLKALNSSDNKHDLNEDKVMVLQTIIDGKPILDDSFFKDFISILQGNSVAMTKSLKFAKLVLATINNYGPQIVCHKDVIEAILQSNGTFLKKAGLSALKKALAKAQT